MRRIGRETEDKGLVLIVTGPAASGKTSVAVKLAEESEERSVHLHGDDFFRALKSGRLRGWEDGSEPQHQVVFDAISSAANAYAKGGYFVVLDSLIRPPYLEVVTEILSRSDIELHYVVLRPSLAETRARSNQRDESKRHQDDILEYLYEAFENLGSLEAHVIDNTTLTVDQTAAVIRSRMGTEGLRL